MSVQDDERARAAIASAFSWLSTPSLWNSLSSLPPTAASAWDAAFSGADVPTPTRLVNAVARLRELVAVCVDEMQPRIVSSGGTTTSEGMLNSSDDSSATRRQRAVEALRECVSSLAVMLSSLRDQEAFATLVATHSGGGETDTNNTTITALGNPSILHSLAAARLALERIDVAVTSTGLTTNNV
jgi:hypothetical protein